MSVYGLDCLATAYGLKNFYCVLFPSLHESYIGISLIEWPDRLGTILEERVEKYDQNVLCVNLYYALNNKGITQETANNNCSDLRTVELIPRGSCWKERLNSLLSDTGGLTFFLIK